MNPSSEACVATAPAQFVADLALGRRWPSSSLTAGVVLVCQIARLRLVRAAARSVRPTARSGIGLTAAVGGRRRSLAVGGVHAATWPIVNQAGFRIEPIAAGRSSWLLLAVAWVVATARDARRFVAGVVLAAVGLVRDLVSEPRQGCPLPSTIVNAYQGLLPT